MSAIRAYRSSLNDDLPNGLTPKRSTHPGLTSARKHVDVERISYRRASYVRTSLRLDKHFQDLMFFRVKFIFSPSVRNHNSRLGTPISD
jgi:hypothetical protein